MRNVALDFGGKVTFCEVANGTVVARATVSEFWELRNQLGRGSPPARVAVEACREAWFLHDQLKAWGHEPLIVDTTRCKKLGIGHHKRKNDRIDAEVLARAVEDNLIPLAHVLSPPRRALREQQSVRRTLVEARAQQIVCVRGFIRAATLKKVKGGSDPARFVRLVRALELEDKCRELLAPLLDTIADLNVRIAKVDLAIEKLGAEEPVTMRLRTTPGVATVVSSAFVSVIDDPKRFKNAHQVQSYIGLVPSEDTSVHRRLGHITKHGNSYLRAMLVQAAWSVLRMKADDPLKAWGLSIAKRRGNSVAAVAVARRLAGILWAMWRDGTVYEAPRLGQASADGLERQAQSTQVVADAIKRATSKTNRKVRFAKRMIGVN